MFQGLKCDSTTKRLTDYYYEDYEFYLTKSGEVLFKDPLELGAVLYSSLDDFQRVYDDVINMEEGPIDLFGGYSIEKFSELNIKESLSKYFNAFNIYELNFLNVDEIRKSKLEDNINTTIDNEDYFDRHFYPLTVLVGEILRSELGGEWRLNKTVDGTEVYLELDDKSRVLPWMHMMKDLNERKEIDLVVYLAAEYHRIGRPIPEKYLKYLDGR